MLRGDLVHVAGLTDVAVGVVDGAERFFAFGVCAVPEFGAVGGVRVDVVQQGFEAAHVLAGCRVAAAVCAAPFVVYEASRVAAEGDGVGHCVVVADVAGEVGLLLAGERVPRVGERLHDGEVGGEEVGCFGGLVNLGGVHGWVSFFLVVGVFSCVDFSTAHVWVLCSFYGACFLPPSCRVCHVRVGGVLCLKMSRGRWHGPSSLRLAVCLRVSCAPRQLFRAASAGNFGGRMSVCWQKWCRASCGLTVNLGALATRA